MSASLPETNLPGAIPTLNGRGFMLEALDDYATEFTQRAGETREEVLDIGCAYGVATLAALENGAKVCACDMEPAHLAILAERTKPENRAQLRTVVGHLPQVQFANHSFAAILASRVIHFLNGADLQIAVTAMSNWLLPGGRLFLVADTPYMPGWDSIVPAYEAAKRTGELWPGFIPDFAAVRREAKGGPPAPAYLNTLDPDILARECERVGLVVERATFFGLQRLGDKSNGREHAGCVAVKPS